MNEQLIEYIYAHRDEEVCDAPRQHRTGNPGAVRAGLRDAMARWGASALAGVLGVDEPQYAAFMALGGRRAGVDSPVFEAGKRFLTLQHRFERRLQRRGAPCSAPDPKRRRRAGTPALRVLNEQIFYFLSSVSEALVYARVCTETYSALTMRGNAVFLFLGGFGCRPPVDASPLAMRAVFNQFGRDMLEYAARDYYLLRHSVPHWRIDAECDWTAHQRHAAFSLLDPGLWPALTRSEAAEAPRALHTHLHEVLAWATPDMLDTLVSRLRLVYAKKSEGLCALGNLHRKGDAMVALDRGAGQGELFCLRWTSIEFPDGHLRYYIWVQDHAGGDRVRVFASDHPGYRLDRGAGHYSHRLKAKLRGLYQALQGSPRCRAAHKFQKAITCLVLYLVFRTGLEATPLGEHFLARV